jgi:hypothetical protein
VPDPEPSRSDGELVPLRRPTSDHEIVLEPPTLEPLTSAQEAEAADLLAALFAAAAKRRDEPSPLREAA